MVIRQILQGQLESEARPEPKSPVFRQVEKKADRNIVAGSEGIDGQQQGAGSNGSVPVWCGTLTHAVQLVRGTVPSTQRCFCLLTAEKRISSLKTNGPVLIRSLPAGGPIHHCCLAACPAG